MTAEHAAGVGGEVEARQAVAAYVAEVDAFFGDDECPDDVIDTADGSHDSAPLRLSDLRLLVGPTVETWAEGWDVRPLIEARLAATRQTAADTVLAAARRLCCGENPAPHHAATDAHSTRMAFAEELARAVRRS